MYACCVAPTRKPRRSVSATERKELAEAHKLLRECAQVLKQAGVSQNAIARRAKYSSGYMPQLLRDDSSPEKLTRTSIARLATGIELLARDSSSRLTEAERLRLRRHLEALKARYGTVRHEVIRPGQPLKRSAINYVHRSIDGLLSEDLVQHDAFMVDGVMGPPFSGKTWALENLAFSAADTHEVFYVDLSARTDGSEESVVVRFVEELRAHRAILADDDIEPFTPKGPVRVQKLAQEVLLLVDAARVAVENQDRQLLVIVDGPDRAGDPYRLLGLLRELQQKGPRAFPGLADVWLVVAFSEPGATEDKSTAIRPTWPVGYFKEDEVRRLFELHQEVGSLRDWSWDGKENGIDKQIQLLGGHPGLIAQFFDDCHRLGREATAKGVISPVGSGWGLLDAQCRRFAAAWRRTQARSFRERSKEIIESTDIEAALTTLAYEEDSLRRLLARFGLIQRTADNEVMPFVESIGNALRTAVHAESVRPSS
jgi:transcriptional regulator with XRE-family HTH domain